jgi:transposase InsO family protein
MAIRDRPTAARSPWQNGCAERLIGSIRRDCLDNVIVLGERHLRHLLKSYQSYYNEVRTHFSLSKDAPVRVRSRLLATSSLSHSSEDYTTNTFGFDFRSGQPLRSAA